MPLYEVRLSLGVMIWSWAQSLRGRWINWSRITGDLYLVSCSSGKQNSSTSLVGIVLIFSDLSAGMLSSRTVPRRGRRSEVLTISRYMKWSLVLERWWPPTSLLSSTVAGTLSLLMETASGPRFSSIPNQFWWSGGGIWKLDIKHHHYCRGQFSISSINASWLPS